MVLVNSQNDKSKRTRTTECELVQRKKGALTPGRAFGVSLNSFSTFAMEPTFRPHRLKRARKIGFRARMATVGGRKVISARRRKGRKRLTVV